MSQTLPKTKSFRWKKTSLQLLDQRLLPQKTVWITCKTWQSVASATREMVVRGAPAIGCAAAYGVVLAAKQKQIPQALKGLLAARPTAVNLQWALERMEKIHNNFGMQNADCGIKEDINKKNQKSEIAALEAEAIAIETEDRLSNQSMGRLGSDLLPQNAIVMTICNTGSLATAGLGTAFGVIWSAHHAGKLKHVYALETRPYLQGSRLTAYELQQEKIPFELITDSMAAHLMKTEKISAILVGADRIAANGDTANKIGTYSLAVLAQHHEIPFYVVAPWSTVDLRTPTGQQIPIEERSTKEVLEVQGKSIAPKGARARHPAFDVTPSILIRAIVTDRGVVKPPFSNNLRLQHYRGPFSTLHS